MVINYLMTETTDENLLRQLTVAQYTYCDSLWSQRWTRSKQKAFTEWLEYMEKCVEMAKNVSWGDIAILHIDEDEQETLFRRDDFFDEGHYQTDTNEENVEMINDWTDEHISGEDEEPDISCTDCDYTIEKNRFDRGGGRIMFTDVVGEYRCGVCDDRCSDPDGMFPDTDDGNWVEPTKFEEFTYHGTTFWKNVDEASSKRGQWFYEYNNGEVGDELGIYTSDTELEFSWDGKNAGDYVPVLYWCGVIGEKMFLNDNLHPVAKLIKQLRIRPMIATLREENAKLREENAKLREEQQRLREEQQRLLAQTSV